MTTRLRLACVLAVVASATLINIRAAGSLEKTRELVAVLQSSTDLEPRARACQQLTIVGTEDAVPALARLLADDKLSHYAREALEAMPYPAAGDALRAALGTLQGPLLIGVVTSVGMRRDASAVGSLTQLATSGGAGVAPAALLALGRIAAAESTSFLQKSVGTAPDEATRAAAAEACLLIAENLVARNRREPAVALYDFVRGAHVSELLQASAAQGALLARGAAALPLLLDLLRSDHPAMREVALRAVRELPGAEITGALVTELPKTKPAVRPLLIVALTDRGDPAALGAIEAAATGDDETARRAALAALGRIGGNSSLPHLLRAAATADADLAVASLGRIPASEANATLLRALPTAAPALRAKLIGALAERAAVTAIPELMQLATAGDPDVQKAALRALGILCRPAELPALIRIAIAARDAETRTLADRAVATTSMKVLDVERRADAVLAALRAAPDGETKRSLLRPLGAIVRSMGGSEPALHAVRALLRDASAPVRESALQCLADWPTAAPAAALLEILGGQPSATERDIALSGAIRMAANVAAGRDATTLDALAAFTQASRLVRTREERLMLVSALGSLQRIEALYLLQPYLEDREVRTEAGLALVQIAPALLTSSHAAEVKRALEELATSDADEDVRRKAARLAKGPPAPSAGKKKAATRNP